MTAVESPSGVVGTSVKRKEDAALLRGRTRWVDNLSLPGMVYMAVVRSPYPHARIKSIDFDGARTAEGFVAAFTGADLADDWAGGLPCAWPVTEDIKMPPHFPLAVGEARYQGDPVAVVVAESRALAKDAAELVEVDYEPLPSIFDVEKALDHGAPLVHSDLGTNECYVWKLDAGEAQAAIDTADVVVTQRYYQPRLIPNAMEPRGVLAQVGPTGDVTLWSATQTPHIQRFVMQLVFGIAESKIRVIAPDVGGGFGSKIQVYAEGPLAIALARRLGRPVKWTEERAENYVGTIHGRDVVHELTFAATRDAAPVLHFDGPLRMGFEIRQPLKRAKDGFELNACVGTPGSCDGAWVHMLYRTIPADKFPHVKMELPAEKPGGPPVRLDFALKQRC